MWSFVFTFIVLIADRIIKNIAQHGALADFGPLHFGLVRNDALVFSWPAPNWVAATLMVFALGVVGLIIRLAWQRRNWMAVRAGGWIGIGAMSNLFDRVTHGYVIDWAYFGRWWPVFNLADVMIAAGVVLLLWQWPRLTTPAK